jgi:ribosomal protein S18 acetylase RimI-like enzyme
VYAGPIIPAVSRIVPITSATRGQLPPPCVDCVFWQHDLQVSDERRKTAWIEAFERRHGAFARVIGTGDEFRGMIQYGPASAFPRAYALPAGPPDRDAALVTCVFIEGDDAPGTGERLLLEALADLKSRGARAVESFTLRYPESVPPEDRFLGHHTLLDRAFLEGLGFTVVRTRGQVSLMRLALGTLTPSAGLLDRMARLVRPEPAEPEPAPA